MRKALIGAGPLLAMGLLCLGVAGCGQKAEEVVAPAPHKKSMARQDQMYAGEEQVQSITTGSVERGYGEGVLVLKATAVAPTAGYTRPYFLPRIYPATPPDGIFEIDVVAAAPPTPGAAAPTELKVEGAWSKYKDDRVKGVKFMTKTNSLVAMLPPRAAEPAVPKTAP